MRVIINCLWSFQGHVQSGDRKAFEKQGRILYCGEIPERVEGTSTSARTFEQTGRAQSKEVQTNKNPRIAFGALAFESSEETSCYGFVSLSLQLSLEKDKEEKQRCFIKDELR